MGPLYSFAFAAIGFAVVVSVAFLVLSVFWRMGQAFALAGAFAFGGFLGVGLAVVSAMPVVGIGQPLHSSAAVVAYLGSLCMGGLIGGGLSVRLASRVLTRRSSGRAFGAPLT